MKRAVAAGADVYAVDIAMVEEADQPSDFQRILAAKPSELQETVPGDLPRRFTGGSATSAGTRSPNRIRTRGTANRTATVQTDTAQARRAEEAVRLLVTAASDIAIGAVLLQDFGNVLQPIAYESRKLHLPEKNYPIHDREMLAIVDAFKVWRCYLIGADMTPDDLVLLDTQNLRLPITPKLRFLLVPTCFLVQSFICSHSNMDRRGPVFAACCSPAPRPCLRRRHWPVPTRRRPVVARPWPVAARRWPVAGPLRPCLTPPVAGPALQQPCRGPSFAARCGPALQPPAAALPCCRPSRGPACTRPCPAEPRRPLSRTTLPSRAALPSHAALLSRTALPASAATTAMANPTVLTFDAEGHAVDFDLWVDDLHLFLQCDSRDGWTTRDAVAHLAVCSHMPPAERAHFGQYKIAKSLYDAVVARYSSPATSAFSRLMLPYLFPDLPAFATVADLITHLRTSDARYRAALPTEFYAKNPPPMYITLYYLVTSLPNSLSSIRDHFLSLCLTELTIDLLEEHLATAEKSILAVGASRGDRRCEDLGSRVFPCSLLPSVASAAAVDLVGTEEVGAASAPSERRLNSKGKGSKGGGGDGGGGSGGGGVSGSGGFSGGGGGGGGSGGGGRGSGGGGGGSGSGGAGRGAAAQRGGFGGSQHKQQPRSRRLSSFMSGTLGVGGLGFPDAVELPRWHDLRTGESAAPSAGEFALSVTAPTEALHTFTLDSGASRSFFRDSTTLSPLIRPAAVSLADPSGGPVLAHSSTVLPCPAAPSGLLSGLHLPSFSTNLVSGADLQDAWVDQFTPGGQRVTHCTCSRMGRHLATFTRRPGSSLYTLTTAPPPVSASGQVAASSQVFAAESRSSTRVTPQSSPCASRVTSLRGGEFSSDLLSCVGHPPDSFAVQYAAHQINLKPRVSLPETTPTLRWTGKVGDASAFRVWGSRAFARDTSADKLSSRAIPCAFLGFPPDAPGWQFCHPTSRRVLSSQGVTFDESVSYYCLFLYRTASLPPPPLFLAPGTPPVDPLPPQGPAPSGVSQLDPAEPVEVAVESGAARGAELAGAGTGGAEPGGAEPERVGSEGAEPTGAGTGGVESGGAEPERVEPGGAEPWGTASWGAEPARAKSGGSPGVPLRREPLSPQRLRAAGAGAAGGAAGAGAAGGAAGAVAARGAASAGATGGAAGAGAAGPGGASTGGTGAAGAGGAAGVGATCTGAGGAAGVVAGDPGAEGTGAVSTVPGGATRPRPYYVPLLQ
ncbi:unnamed protein product [Closterium sp. NIES-54]